jgi:hypothetical protein
MLRNIWGIRGTGCAVEEEWRTAIGKCSAASWNSRYCSTELVDVQLGLHWQVRRAPVVFREGLDGFVGEPLEEG